jgi:hypothetical protein
MERSGLLVLSLPKGWGEAPIQIENFGCSQFRGPAQFSCQHLEICGLLATGVPIHENHYCLDPFGHGLSSPC